MKIGVFDSGVGGKYIADAIQKALPDLEIVLREDSKNLPYGTKTPDQLLELVTPIFEEMISEGCQLIVVACNTVTTTIISDLRQKFTTPFVAIEPMIKPAAAQTKTKIIAVCATPTTLASKRYAQLKDKFARDITVLEPDCSDWASMIQNQEVNQQIIATRIDEVLNKNADVIVLACTHYHWIEEEIKELANDEAEVLQPTEAIIERLKRVLVQLR